MPEGSNSASLFAEIEGRFGLLPNFFRFAARDVSTTAFLWDFARHAYLDSGLPSLFKERLFVYLSRFCPVRYCIARHVGFVVGLGHASGDRGVVAQTVEDVLPLLVHPLPAGVGFNPIAALGEWQVEPFVDLPAPGTPEELDLFACAAHVFLNTAEQERAQKTLLCLLGPDRMEQVNVLLAFVRTAHYWAELNPNLELEADVEQLLATHQILADQVRGTSESSQYKLNSRILQELIPPEKLRQEHRDLLQDIEDRAHTQEALRDSERRLSESDAWQSAQKDAFQADLTGAPLSDSLAILCKAGIKHLGDGLGCAFYAVDTEAGTLHHVTGMPEICAECVDGFRIGPDSPACGLAVYRNSPVITPDVMQEPRWEPWRWLAEKYGFRGCWSFPLESTSGKTIGTVAMYFKHPREATPRDMEAAEVLSHAAAIIMSRNFLRVDHARAEAALRESEQRYQALFAASPVPFMVLAPNAPDFTITAANDAYLAATLTSREGLVGRRLFDVFTDDRTRLNPDGPTDLHVSLDRVLATRRTDAMPRTRLEITVPGGGFEERWWLAINAPVLGSTGEVVAIIHQVTDETELHRAQVAERDYQKRQAFLLKLSDTLRGFTSSNEMQQAAMKLLTEHLGLSRAFYFTVERDSEGWAHVIDSEHCRLAGLPPMIGRHSLKDFGSQLFEELGRGKALQVDDVASLPGITSAELASYQTVGVGAFLHVPLLRDGDYSAGVTAHDPAPRVWKQAEIDLLREVGDRIGPAVERARAEAALRESERRFRTLANAAPALIWFNDAAGKNNFLNDHFLNYTGLTAEQIHGEGWHAIIHAEDAPAYIASYLAAVKERGAWHNRHRIRRYDGAWHWFDNYAHPLLAQDGTFLGHVGVSTDINAAVEVEKDLRESEERFRLFVENVREYALVQTDFEGMITSWNPGGERLFGYTSAETVGRHFIMLFPEADRHSGLIAREMAKLSHGGRNTDGHVVQRKDGTQFWGEWITEPVLDDAGKLRGTAKVMRDETDRQRADESLRASLAEKEALLAEVHHRVKNNLQVITSMLSLQARGLVDEGVLTLFKETRNRVQSIASIHEMLYRSSNFANVDLFAYAKQLVPDLVRFYGAHRRLRVQIEGGDAWLELERAVPFGLLVNELVSNALKHGVPEPESGLLHVGVRGENGTLFLTVQDSGRGIPLNRPMENGSSLGLKLVHILVRQLNGKIEFHSNAGTIVNVLIPVTSGSLIDGNIGTTSEQNSHC